MASAGFVVPDAQELDGAYALFMKDRDGIRVEVSFEAGLASAEREP